MPDLNVVSALTCSSNVFWKRKVRGSTGKLYYVTWGRTPQGQYLYGWACTCPDHVHRGRECKHIKAAVAERCGWNACLEPNQMQMGDRCPDCGAPLEAFNVAV